MRGVHHRLSEGSMRGVHHRLSEPPERTDVAQQLGAWLLAWHACSHELETCMQ